MQNFHKPFFDSLKGVGRGQEGVGSSKGHRSREKRVSSTQHRVWQENTSLASLPPY